MNLYYLIYTSVPASVMSDEDLQQLLDTSREGNKQFEVTGILICLPESYIQLIEGPRQHIEKLYENIQRDPRHMQVITLQAGPIDHRFFPDWAMAFSRQDSDAKGLEFVSLQDEKVLQLFDIMENQY
jgi:hypothetical protein